MSTIDDSNVWKELKKILPDLKKNSDVMFDALKDDLGATAHIIDLYVHTRLDELKKQIRKEMRNHKVTVLFKKYDDKIETEMPVYVTDGSSGMDIRSVVDKVIKPNTSGLIQTNLSVEIPQGHEIQIRSRSGLAAKFNVTVLNSPGTIDASYRGEIKIILFNHGQNDFPVHAGDRIAQIVLCKVEIMQLFESESLSDTERSDGGFGSTGIK